LTKPRVLTDSTCNRTII